MCARRRGSLAIGAKARPWWVVAAMSLPLLLVTIDFYGLSVALPAIGRGLGVGTTTLQRTMNGFFLALAAALAYRREAAPAG